VFQQKGTGEFNDWDNCIPSTSKLPASDPELLPTHKTSHYSSAVDYDSRRDVDGIGGAS
jgi:hypothetical protein